MDPITADGTYYFDLTQRSGRSVIMDICGDLGGATVVPGFKAADGEFSPYLKPDGASSVSVTARGGLIARVGREGLVGVQVTGAGVSTSIILDVIPAVDMPPGS